MSIIASWGGYGSNCYIGLTEANSFISASVLDNSAWTSATTIQQAAALLTATSHIDGIGTYIYSRKYSDQTLEFPRGLASDWQSLVISSDGTLSYLEQRMQSAVERATCVQALYLLQQLQQKSHYQMTEAGVREVEREVGPVRERFVYQSAADEKTIAGSKKSRLCKEAMDYLSDWLTSRRIIRG